jgi:ribosomal protein S18 acetylase RimI-like enzyme
MDNMAQSVGLKVRLFTPKDIDATLEVYRECEDFLSLGPVPKASTEMVLADFEHSKNENGIYCCVIDKEDRQIGVLDFIPEVRPHTAFLSLLMIAKPYRQVGNGRFVVAWLENHLFQNYATESIESGVQVNNEAGKRFWKAMGFRIGSAARILEDKTVAYEMRKELKSRDIG